MEMKIIGFITLIIGIVIVYLGVNSEKRIKKNLEENPERDKLKGMPMETRIKISKLSMMSAGCLIILFSIFALIQDGGEKSTQKKDLQNTQIDMDF